MANGGIRRIEGARLAVMAVKRGGKGRRIAGHAHRGSRRGHRPPGHAHRHRARMKWVERRLGVVGNEGRDNRRRNNKQETGCISGS